MRGTADGGGCFPTGHHYPGIAHLLRVMAAGLVEEFGGELTLRELPIVAIDTETTGKQGEQDRVVEVACVFRRAGEISDHRSWLINPGCPIPEEATSIHGIHDEDVRDKPTFAEVAAEISEAVEGQVPLAYNAEFDRRVLLAEFARADAVGARPPPALRADVVWIDPLVWARELQKEHRSRKLVDVCPRLGIEIGQAHRATDDAVATLKVMAAFEADPRVPTTYAAFITEQQRLARRMEEQWAIWRRRRGG